MMFDTNMKILSDQIDAALRMLDACIDKCPDAAWDGPVCNLAFCQAAFHVLFFTDCYLGSNTDAMKTQQFHRDHPQFFRDYEELQDKKQELLYDRPTVKKYLDHCRRKAQQVIAAETEQTLAATCGFEWLKCSRAELYLYNLRHIQHHAAQLSLRLRLDTGDGVPWTKSTDATTPKPN